MIIAIRTILLAAAVAYANGANNVSKGVPTLWAVAGPPTLAASPGAPSQIRTSPASSLIACLGVGVE